MNSAPFLSSNTIRLQFTQAISNMYQLEVPLYNKLLEMVNSINQDVIKKSPELTAGENWLLSSEYHGAIRVGTASELSMVRRLFNVMGMHPVDYYDLSVAGIPVHSTAFRALDRDDLASCPFRVFCSLLRLELLEDDQLRQQAENLLNKRLIFPIELLKLIELSEKQGGLWENQATAFVESAIEVFRWHENTTVDKDTYDALKTAHNLVADVVSFKGPHINHLTPKVLDIDACQNQFFHKRIKAKKYIEGPPKRNCPILLRQTSFIAIAEKIKFSDGKSGSHTARFGEVEQRGIALTPKGRELYDQLLLQARNADSKIDYNIRLEQVFKDFPDDYEQIRRQGLGYFHYSPTSSNNKVNPQVDDMSTLIEQGVIQVTPIVYEDFLPVSAAGIFTSNLSIESSLDEGIGIHPEAKNKSSLNNFEEALGVHVENSFDLYEKLQQSSLDKTFEALN